MTLNPQELKMAATTILNLDPDEYVKDFVIIAHTHEGDECMSKIVIGANCPKDIAITMVASCIPRMISGEINYE